MGNKVVSAYGTTRPEAVKNLDLTLMCELQHQLHKEKSEKGTRFFMNYGGRLYYVYVEKQQVFNRTIYKAWIQV